MVPPAHARTRLLRSELDILTVVLGGTRADASRSDRTAIRQRCADYQRLCRKNKHRPLCRNPAEVENGKTFSLACQSIRLLLTAEAQFGPRYRLQPFWSDFLFALQADPIRSVANAVNGRTKPSHERRFAVDDLHSYVAIGSLSCHVNGIGHLVYTDRVGWGLSRGRFLQLRIQYLSNQPEICRHFRSSFQWTALKSRLRIMHVVLQSGSKRTSCTRDRLERAAATTKFNPSLVAKSTQVLCAGAVRNSWAPTSKH